jgi:SAM-dependent methyltransferase
MTHTTAERAPIWKSEDRLPYHLTQFDEPYRSTVHFERFIRSLIATPRGDAIDVACGAGANICYLARMLDGYRWTGLDLAGEVLFPIGREQLARRGVTAELVVGDLYRLREELAGRRFDLVISMQTLMALPRGYEAALDELLASTRGWLCITSLFTDAEVDATIELMDYTKAPGRQGPFWYNVYSLPRFRAYCEAAGCRAFVSQDFEIDIDLPPPPTPGLATYTRRLDTGQRLQFSGPLLMPWKFVGVCLDEGYPR